MPLVPKDDLPNDLVPAGDVPATGERSAAAKPHFNVSPPTPYDIGGSVTDIGSKIGLPPSVAAGAGYAANVGLDAASTFLGGKALEAGVAPAAKWGGRWLMTSALKPEKYYRDTGKGAQAVETLLQKGINVSEGGVKKLQGMIDDLNKEIKAAIERSPEKIDKNIVAKYADEVAERVKRQVTPGADMATVQKAINDWLQHPLIKGDEMPMTLAQELKQGTYRSLGEKSYGELKGADVEAQKALARGLKEEIAKKVPGIADLNKQESELLNAHIQSASRMALAKNRNPIGIGWLIENPDKLLIWIADRNEFIKSLIARSLYSGGLARTTGRVTGAIPGVFMQRPSRNQSVTPTQPIQQKPLPQNEDTPITSVRG